MPDQAPAAPLPPTPAEVAENLTAAKQVGGMAWRQQAQRYVDAGVPLSSADRQLLASMNRTLPGAPVDEAMKLGGLSPSDARNEVQGNKLLAAGRSLEQVRETIGNPSFEGDKRTAAQIEHDRTHGMTLAVNPASYFVPDNGMNIAPALDTAARELAAGLKLNPTAGANFMKTVYTAAADLAGSADRGMLSQRWGDQLKQIYPGDKLAEAERQVDGLLKEYGGDGALAKRLREHGVLKNPALFVALRNRALSLAAWRSSRP